MSPSEQLRSFDPFAIHPFTDTSGVIPPPPMPSQYPGASYVPTTYAQQSNAQSPPSPTTPTSSQPPSPLYAPQPTPSYMTSPPSTSAKHIFVPFRKDNASPELVLKKKSPNSSPTRSS